MTQLDNYFIFKARKGLSNRLAKLNYKVDTKVYEDRLEFELNVITKMGFSGYFLVVQDFVNWAKSNNIFVGAGRGSGAGSLCAFSLGITNVDPIKYDLYFERFLNPGRAGAVGLELPSVELTKTKNELYDIIESGEYLNARRKN